MALYDDFLAGRLGNEDRLLKLAFEGRLSGDEFLRATPAERQRYLTHNQFTQNIGVNPKSAAHALRSVTNGPQETPLTEQQVIQALSGMDPAFARPLANEFGGMVTAWQQSMADKDFGTRLTGAMSDFADSDYFIPAVATAMFGGAGALGGAAAPAAGVESATTGGTAASGAASMMPAAVPETAWTLAEWGMLETAPGVFSLPEAGGYVGASSAGTPMPEMTSTGAEGTEPVAESSTADTLKTAAAGASLATNAAALMSGDTGGTEDMSGQLLEEEEERQRRIAEATAAVNSAFAGFDDNYYTSIADAYKNFAMPQFTEQATEARRRLPMSVPHTQSSAYTRKAAGLETDIGRSEAEIARSAIAEANKRRGEIDYTRQELIGLASSGADVDAVSQQAAARAQSLAAVPEFSPLADLFGKYTQNVANAAFLRPTQAQPQATRPLTFSHSPGRSVRNVQ